MLKTVEGILREGKIELREIPEGLDRAKVLVTFLDSSALGQGPSLTPNEAAELRGRLAAWEEDWQAPGMEAYDEL